MCWTVVGSEMSPEKPVPLHTAMDMRVPADEANRVGGMHQAEKVVVVNVIFCVLLES